MPKELDAQRLEKLGYKLPYPVMPLHPPSLKADTRLIALISGRNFLQGWDVTVEAKYYELLQLRRACGAPFRVEALYIVSVLALKENPAR